MTSLMDAIVDVLPNFGVFLCFIALEVLLYQQRRAIVVGDI